MSKTAQRHLWTLLAFIILAALFTWPLALHFTTHVIGPYHGDNFEYVWKTWWVSHAIFERHISPFHHPEINYPEGYDLAYGEITPIHTFLFAPLTAVIGEVPVYNLLILLSIVSSGWFMYLLAWEWLQRLPLSDGSAVSPKDNLRWAGAFFAGIAFAFCAYRMVRIVGHLPLIDTQWLILAFLGLDRWLDHQRKRDAILIGLGISFAALSSWYYALMLLWFLPIYVLARGDNLRQLLKQRPTWVAIAIIGLIVGMLCIPFLLPYLEIATSGETKVPLDDASFWAASPLDYLMPNPRHPLWGRPVRFIMWPIDDNMPLEFMLSIEWVVLLFAWMGWKTARSGHWRSIKWMIGIAFILSLGPFLHIGRLPLGIPLPTLLIREILPGADGVRSWGRFSIIVMFGACLLAAVGLIRWLEQNPLKRQRLQAGGILALLLFSLWVGPAKLVKIEPRPVDEWLAAQADSSPIMQYPIPTALSGPSMLYTRYHGKPVIFGYGTYFPFIFRDRHPDLYEFPEGVALDELQKWGVRYILINLDELNEDTFSIEEVNAQPRLRHIITLDGEAVYELLAARQSIIG
jgi:hypothetical protein